MVEHRRGVGHRRAGDLRPGAHRPRFGQPSAGALVNAGRPDDPPVRAPRELGERERLGSPAERALGMASEKLVGRHQRARRARRAFFEPAQHVARADQDHDRGEPRVAWQDALEDQVEGLRADAGSRDAADVHPRHPERPDRRRRRQQTLERARPVDVLIEQVAFGLTAAGDEHAIERLSAAGPRHFRPALAVAVHVEARDRVELRQRLAIDVEAKALTGETHVVGAPGPDPRARGEFSQHDGRGRRQEREQPDAHARLQPRKRRGVRSTYGSPR